VRIGVLSTSSRERRRRLMRRLSIIDARCRIRPVRTGLIIMAAGAAAWRACAR